MTVTPLNSGVALCALLAFTAPALADITAEDAWQQWVDLAERSGQQIEAAEIERLDIGLRVLGITTRFDMPGDADLPAGELVIAVNEVVFEELSDGRVAIRTPDSYAMEIDFNGIDGEDASITIIVSQPDADIIASGTPAAIRYDYDIPVLGISLEQFEVESDDAEDFDMTMDIQVQDALGHYVVADGDVTRVESVFEASGLAMQMLFDFPEDDGGAFDFAMTMEDLTSETSGALLPGNTFGTAESLADFGQMLGAQLPVSVAAGYGPTTFVFSGAGDAMPFSFEGSMESGRYAYDLTEEGLSYDFANTGMRFLIPPMPGFPGGEFAIGALDGLLEMPILPSPEPEAFSILLRMTDLSLPEALYAMVDPQGLIPRDPARVEFRIDGLGRWLVDITDRAQAEELEANGGMPGELTALDLTRLAIEAAGARLTGDGSVTFPETGGIAALAQPEGSVNLRLEGANALIDRLVQLGLLPEDQAMGARMMLGAFARPGPGEDTLTTRIELLPDGTITANGQRIR